MKRTIVIIGIFILSMMNLFACVHSSNPDPESLSNEDVSQNNPSISSYDFIDANTFEENKYYKILYSDYLYFYCIYNEDGEIVKTEGPLDRQPRISVVDGLVKVTVQAGTGLGTQCGYYYRINDGMFSQIFQCIYDQWDGRVAYGGMNKIVVRDIFDEIIYYREIISFSESFSKMVEPITDVRFINDGDSIEVSYLSGDNYQKVIEIIDLEQYSDYLKLLSEEEQKIADALVCILQDMHNLQGMDEHPAFYSFEGSVVEVTYYEGYTWRTDPLFRRDNEALLDIAPEGITCHLRVPEPKENQPLYFVINIGKNGEDSYYSHLYGWYPTPFSIEDNMIDESSYSLVEDNLHTYCLYIPSW